MNRHFDGLKLLLLRGQIGPRDRVPYFARPDLLAQLLLRQIPTGHDVRIEVGEAAVEEAHLAYPRVAIPPEDVVPSIPIAVLVEGDVLGERVQWEVGGGEGKVEEERLRGVVRVVLGQHLDGVLSDGCGGVVAAPGCDGRQGAIIQGVQAGVEIAVVIVQGIGVVEAAGQDIAVHMPFAGVVGAIAEGAQQLRKESRPGGALAGRASSQTGQGVTVDLLGVIAGENARSRRPAAAGVVELSKPKSATRQSIEVRRPNFASVATRVREPHVIGNDHQDVRTLCRWRVLRKRHARSHNHQSCQQERVSKEGCHFGNSATLPGSRMPLPTRFVSESPRSSRLASAKPSSLFTISGCAAARSIVSPMSASRS